MISIGITLTRPRKEMNASSHCISHFGGGTNLTEFNNISVDFLSFFLAVYKSKEMRIPPLLIFECCCRTYREINPAAIE